MADTLKGIFTWATNGQDYFHYWVGSTLYSDWDTSVLRNILTTIFIVLGHLILFFGSFYLKRYNQRRLLNRESVPISHLTSWLSLTDAASYLFYTLRPPGGYFGWLMLITGAFSIAHQYFVNSFIQQTSIQCTCNFESGIVDIITYNAVANFVPSASLSPATTILNAQLYSAYNGGINGIWRLVPFSAYYFSPTQKDLLGQWNCNPTGNITITSAYWNDTNTLTNFLIDNNLLNNDTGYFAGSQSGADVWDGFLSWYTNYPNSSSAWDTVTAGIAVDLSGEDGTVSEMTCTLSTYNWEPPTIDSKSALMEWNLKAYGSLQDVSADVYGFGLELILNAIFMAAAGGNVDTTKVSALPADTDATYGCVVPGSLILVGIWVILGVYLVTLILLLFGSCLTLLCFRRSYKHNDLVGDPPTSVHSWQAILVRVMTNNFDIKTKSLRNYLAVLGGDG